MNKKKTKCIKDYIMNYNSIAISKLMTSIIFGLFNIDDKYEFIRGENSIYL